MLEIIAGYNLTPQTIWPRIRAPFACEKIIVQQDRTFKFLVMMISLQSLVSDFST